MSSDMTLGTKTADVVSDVDSSPTTTLEYSRAVSQDLRYLDDALTHAIDQLTIFNSETMSDLSLKYELMRNNEVNIDLSNIIKITSYSRVVLSDFLLDNLCY